MTRLGSQVRNGILTWAVVIASVIPASAENWSGFYAGAHLGYGSSSVDWTFPVPVPPIALDHDGDGAIGGIQAGFNWQTGNFVVGGEVDWSRSGIEGGTTCPTITLTCGHDIESLASLRARLGFVITPPSWFMPRVVWAGLM